MKFIILFSILTLLFLSLKNFIIIYNFKYQQQDIFIIFGLSVYLIFKFVKNLYLCADEIKICYYTFKDILNEHIETNIFENDIENKKKLKQFKNLLEDFEIFMWVFHNDHKFKSLIEYAKLINKLDDYIDSKFQKMFDFTHDLLIELLFDF